MAQLPPKPLTSGLSKWRNDSRERQLSPSRPSSMTMSRMTDAMPPSRDHLHDESTRRTFREGGRSPPRSRVSPRDRDTYVPRDISRSSRERGGRVGSEYRGRFDDDERREDTKAREREHHDKERLERDNHGQGRERDWRFDERGRDRSLERNRGRFERRPSHGHPPPHNGSFEFVIVLSSQHLKLLRSLPTALACISPLASVEISSASIYVASISSSRKGCT